MLTKKNKDTVTPARLQHINFIAMACVSIPFILMDDVPWPVAIVIPVIALAGLYLAFYTGTVEMLNQIAKDITEATNNKEN